MYSTDSTDINKIIKIYKIYNTTTALEALNFVINQKSDELIDGIKKYDKNTGIMFGNLYIDQEDSLYILILDFDIIIFKKDILPNFKYFLLKNQTHEKIPLFYMNNQIQKEIEEIILGKNENLTENITKTIVQKNSPNFMNEIKDEIFKCIIKKSQIRTLNNKIISNSSISLKENDFICIKKIDVSIFLVFNTKNQFLYVMKVFDSNEKIGFSSHEINFYENIGNKCPFILNYYGTITTDTQIQIITEYIEGETLLNFITNNKNKLDFLDKILIIIEIMIAIEYIHSNGIILRDLKWDNIMIDSNRNVKLIDFDKTKIIGSNQEEISFTADIGSLYFSSSEQYILNKYSFKSDIYSLGMIIQFILTEKAFDYIYSDIIKILEKDKLNILDLNIIPKYQYKNEKLYSICRKCFEYLPDNRPNISRILNSFLYFFDTINIDMKIQFH